MDPEYLAIIYGLAAAASWGSGDFMGGLASKRAPVLRVVLLSQAVGAGLVLVLALLLQESFPRWPVLGIAALAGMSGVVGVLALYYGLATRPMGLMAPLTAVISALLPVAVGAWQAGLPGLSTLFGFVFALLAVWLLSSPGPGGRLGRCDLGLPLLAGLGFGFFFVLIDRASSTAIYWPQVAVRFGSLSLVLFLSQLGRFGFLPAAKGGHWPAGLPPPWVVIILTGLFDTAGNVFFALSSQAGRLDIATVVSSLYPAGPVLLAALLLRERLSRMQWLGVLSALVALVLIAM
ncbi:MAG: EamA family transporter [Anaerolineales bacterium]|nr:EamA family transporter [Anaerolineales bacterium]